MFTEDNMAINTEDAGKVSDGKSVEIVLTPSSALQGNDVSGAQASAGTGLVPAGKDVVSVSTKKGWHRALGIARANLEKIEEWRGQGKTLEQIADLLEISRSSLYRFREQDAEVHDALFRGTDMNKDKLMSKLCELALNGVTRVEQKEEIGEDGKLHVVERKITNSGPNLDMLYKIASKEPSYSEYEGGKYYREKLGSWPKEEHEFRDPY